MTNNGMRDSIINALPDPNIDGYTKDQAINEAGGRTSIFAIGRAIVREIKASARVTANFTTTGTCGNFTTPPPASVPTSGSWQGTIQATNAGRISGVSSTDIGSAIRNYIEDNIDGADFTVRNARLTVEAISEAISEHINEDGRLSLSSTALTASGTVPASGGPVSRSDNITCKVSNLDADDLKDRIKNKIRDKVENEDNTIDFSKSNAEANILAISSGIVSYIHVNAEIDATIEFDSVICPINPSPTPFTLSSTGSASTSNAPIL